MFFLRLLAFLHKARRLPLRLFETIEMWSIFEHALVRFRNLIYCLIKSLILIWSLSILRSFILQYFFHWVSPIYICAILSQVIFAILLIIATRIMKIKHLLNCFWAFWEKRPTGWTSLLGDYFIQSRLA